MIFEGSLASEKTDMLVDKYACLLNSGVKASEILVIVQNSTLKNNFTEKTFEKLTVECIENLRVSSFSSLVYNTVIDNWAFLEDRNIFDNPVIIPNLAGLEVSQYIMKNILRDVKFKGYNSGISLLHQMFRRYSLIVQNNLSEKDVDDRAKILKEGFSPEAKITLKKFLRETLKLRDFDYLRQCLLFNFIYKNTDYFKNIKYLIVDDADELSPVCIDFITYISKQIKEVFIAVDPLGSSRCGYLSADKNNFEKIKNTFNCEITKLSEEENEGLKLFNNVKNGEKNILKNFSFESFSRRSGMIEAAVGEIKNLLNQKVKPCEIAVISPVIDEMLKFSLRENFKNNIDFLYLSGSEKLIRNRLVNAAIVILKLNTDLKNTLTEFDIRVILSEFLQIPLKYCEDILLHFNKTKELPEFEFSDSEYSEKYLKFRLLAQKLSVCKDKISEQIVRIYNELLCLSAPNYGEINKFNFFLKQIRDFENIFGQDFNRHKSDIIIQVQNSIIAENPYSVLDIKNNEIIVSTPQKIIDNQIKTKYQIWLDISNSNWIKSDTGPLYNAWVFQKDWDKDEYTIEDNINLSRDKNARVLRKLVLCCSGQTYCFSSMFDSNGVENYGAIEEFIVVNEKDFSESAQENTFAIIPRDDQKPVLEYKSGYMGISAVPGAGKTTILLALIISLLERGIDPERIFVLTYMESAARNFRERIKNLRSSCAKLPNISTIHGLALRILKENGNYEKLGLDGNFEICDDSQRLRILREISNFLKINSKMTEEFDRAISVFKMSGGGDSSTCGEVKNSKLSKFLLFYEKYQRILKDGNLIDYDDMLIGSVKILKENPDVLSQYQNICEYLIEDEAQDSSAVQQELITLLSGKHKNIIRCGDVNQSITMTFSNADVEGFRRFITENNNVSMNCSQRCCEPVYSLANKLVKVSKTTEGKNAFFEMYMNPVEGKNPKDGKASGIVFGNSVDEKNFVLKTIKETLSKHPDYTIGILLRYNYQVGEWQNLIENSGIKVITRNQCLEQKYVFRAIYAVMQMILTPFDNELVAYNYSVLADLGFYRRGLDSEILKYENPFIKINADNIESVDLQQFYWDLNYWVSLSHLLPDEIAVKAGLQFFKSDIEKSNIYLISTLIKRICINNNSLVYALSQLKELAKRQNLSGFKFFEDEDEEDKKLLAGKVQIMTMHKSKGDEFDLVFIPQMSEKNLPFTMQSVDIKSADFTEDVKRLNPKYKQKSEDEIKKEILDENLRLLYVAITRAKHDLYITTSTKTKNKFGKEQKNEPNIIFQTLINTEVR